VRRPSKEAARGAATKVALALCVLGAAVSAPCEGNSVSDEALARDYVLAACIINKYPNSELAHEAEVWAEGLVQRGTGSALIYPKLAEIARTDAPAPLQSRSGVRMLMASCVELYNSPALKKKLAKLIR
jgi:hypothetical protein